MRSIGRRSLALAALGAMLLSADAQGVLADPCYETDWDRCVVRETGVDELPLKRHVLRERCERGGANACVVLGIMQASGVGGSTDYLGSEYSLWRACELDPDACGPIAKALASGDHVNQDEKLAKAILVLRARGGLVYVGETDPKRGGGVREGDDSRRAVVLDATVQDCVGEGAAEACAKAAIMYERGTGTDQDRRAAYQHFWLACDLDRSLCMDIAQAYREGKRVGRSRKHARTFRKLALQREGRSGCRYGDTERCVTYGYAYLDGTHASHDEQYAAVLFAEACEAGNPRGCTGLAALRWSGQGIDKNRAKAVELYRRACRDGDGAACWKLGRLYLRGEHVTQDPARAEKLFERACDLGDQAGCNYTKKRPPTPEG